MAAQTLSPSQNFTWKLALRIITHLYCNFAGEPWTGGRNEIQCTHLPTTCVCLCNPLGKQYFAACVPCRRRLLVVALWCSRRLRWCLGWDRKNGANATKDARGNRWAVMDRRDKATAWIPSRSEYTYWWYAKVRKLRRQMVRHIRTLATVHSTGKKDAGSTLSPNCHSRIWRAIVRAYIRSPCKSWRRNKKTDKFVLLAISFNFKDAWSCPRRFLFLRISWREIRCLI